MFSIRLWILSDGLGTGARLPNHRGEVTFPGVMPHLFDPHSHPKVRRYRRSIHLSCVLSPRQSASGRRNANDLGWFLASMRKIPKSCRKKLRKSRLFFDRLSASVLLYQNALTRRSMPRRLAREKESQAKRQRGEDEFSQIQIAAAFYLSPGRLRSCVRSWLNSVFRYPTRHYIRRSTL